MKNLLTINEQDIVPNSPTVDTSAFRKRGTARAVLLDDKGQVYLLNVSELMEEVGCKAQIIAELGTVIEYRNYDDGGLEQTSYCYLAKQVGEQVASALEEGELEEGMFEIKAKSVDDAISLLSQDNPDNLEGRFIQKRDLAFLQAAKECL